MPDILHDFPVAAPIAAVFDAFSAPRRLDAWWTLTSRGAPREDAEYELDFGPAYRWRARVTRCAPQSEFELELTEADADWTGTRVGASLSRREALTWVAFRHTGWRSANEHFRVSSMCWAQYLRLMRRHLEHGEFVAYERRLDV
jgi:uncharacterized protein YndB with AHSA1/START domain